MFKTGSAPTSIAGTATNASATNRPRHCAQRSPRARPRVTTDCGNSVHATPLAFAQAATHRSRSKLHRLPVSRWLTICFIPNWRHRWSRQATASPWRRISGAPSCAKSSRSSARQSAVNCQCRADISGSFQYSGSTIYTGTMRLLW